MNNTINTNNSTLKLLKPLTPNFFIAVASGLLACRSMIRSMDKIHSIVEMMIFVAILYFGLVIIMVTSWKVFTSIIFPYKLIFNAGEARIKFLIGSLKFRVKEVYVVGVFNNGNEYISNIQIYREGNNDPLTVSVRGDYSNLVNLDSSVEQ